MDVAAEARAWLTENWDPALDRSAWLDRVVDAGFAVPSWPEAWFGRGAAAGDSQAVANEFLAVGAPGSGQDTANLWANTVLAHGRESLKRQHLRALLTDRLPMCLLYSEPGAGSDLASLQARAERDGDGWVVTGQKVWTSYAHQAEYAFLLARTDWDVPKHQGITFLFFPMRQPGVEVRPIRQITGASDFNEVFITEARVPEENVLGETNGGWHVLQTALAYERVLMGGAGNETTAPRDAGDLEPGRVNATLLGPEAMLDGDNHPRAKAAAFSALNAYFTSIGGGTDQIQRNIIGERILGLPREPQVDRGVPFREVRTTR